MDIMNMFIILYSIIGIQSLLLLFIVWKTPALPFLAASFLKRPIMFIIGKDKMGIFRTFKRQFGAGYVKKEGIYNLTENSYTLEGKSKIAIYFAFRDFAATLTPEYPAIIQEIREHGLKITNIDDLTMHINKIKHGLETDFPIEQKTMKTYRFHDLDNMFPRNIDPTFVEAQVQGQLNRFSKLMQSAPKLIGGIIVLFVAAGIAVFIMQRAFKGCISPGECEMMVRAAKCVATGVQAVTSTVPIT